MKFRSFLLAGVVATMAACSSAPNNVVTSSSDLTDYRIFLSDLSRLSDSVPQDLYDSSKVDDMMQIRDQLYLVMGNAQDFSELTNEQHDRFSALTKQLYRHMCSDRRFVTERAYLYELLVVPDFERQFASL